MHEARSFAPGMGASGKTADVNKVSQTQPQSQSKQRFYSGTGTCKQPADKGRSEGQGNKQGTGRQKLAKLVFVVAGITTATTVVIRTQNAGYVVR